MNGQAETEVYYDCSAMLFPYVNNNVEGREFKRTFRTFDGRNFSIFSAPSSLFHSVL
jgi:hypothetical protein